tara:strand:+ start:232 stop:447 length:216 start_codon:yes stop_codon:yes gene_type:complete
MGLRVKASNKSLLAAQRKIQEARKLCDAAADASIAENGMKGVAEIAHEASQILFRVEIYLAEARTAVQECA